MTQDLAHPAVHPVFRPIPHHSEHSSLGLLAKHVGEPVGVPLWIYRLRGLGAVHRYFKRRSGMEWYDGLYSELATAWHMRTHSKRIYHFICAENDFRFLPSLAPMKKHKVVATFHSTPDEFLRVMKHTEHLKTLSAAIAVSQLQLPMLQSIVGMEKVFFIPLGVDTSYFVPPADGRRGRGKTCLCVGHHHRDLSTLCDVAALVKEQDPEVQFVVIDRVFSDFYPPELQRRYRERFAGLGNVQLKTDVVEAELLLHYQTSDALVLPLLDTTANITILEALSCGLPSVVTDVGGVRDYLDPDCALFAPPNAEIMARLLLDLLRNPTARQERSQACRKKALSFDWSAIAGRLSEVYKALL